MELIILLLAGLFVTGFAVGRRSRGLHAIRPQSRIASELRQLTVQASEQERASLLWAAQYIDYRLDSRDTVDQLKSLAAEASEQERASLEWAASYVEYCRASQPSSPQPVTAQSMVTPPIKPPLTHEQVELRNINTILYVASFLLVAAGIVFIGTSLPGEAKFWGLVCISAAFYGVGLLLHARVGRLRPAAVAFVGTGLALLPFCGIEYYNYISADGPLVWLVTSIVGLLGFVWASYQLKNQVFAYIASAFVFSVVLAGSAELGLPFVWYMLSVIMAATILNVLTIYLPKLFGHLLKPMSQTIRFVAPLGLVASVFTFSSLQLLDYELITAVTAIHYAFAMLLPGDKRPYLSLARIFTITTLALVSYDVTDDLLWSGVVLAACAVATQLYAMQKAASDGYEQVWLWGVQLMLIIATGMWAEHHWVLSGGLLLIAISGAHQVSFRKQAAYGVVGVIALLALPFSIGRLAIEPPLDFSAVAFMLLGLAALSILGRFLLASRREFHGLLIAVYCIAIALASLTVIGAEDWQMLLVYFFGGVLLVVASYVEKQPVVQLFANLLLLIASFMLADVLELLSDWRPVFATALIGAIWYAAHLYLYSLDHTSRRAKILFWSTVVAFGLGFVASAWSHLAVSGGITLGCATGVVLAAGGYFYQRLIYYEGGAVIATLALQRWLGYNTDADMIVYSHWWAVTFAMLAYLRYRKDRQHFATVVWRLVIGLVFLSGGSAIKALDDGTSGSQLLFLSEHVGLLLVGMFFRLHTSRLLTIWGAVGVVLALMWMLRGYTFILLTLLGLGLLIFAVWRLLRRK